MEKNTNIEDLFRDKLNSLEADPGPGVWESLQSQIGQSSTVSSVAGSTSVWSTKGILLVSGISVLGGLGLGYFISSNNSEAAKENNPKTETVAIENTNPVTESNESPITFTETDHTSSIILETKPQKPGESPQKVKITVKNDNKGESIANFFMTPSAKKEQLMQNPAVVTNDKSSENNKSTSANPIATDTKKENSVVQVKEEKLVENHVVALIKASTTGGPAPLYVEFSNESSAENLEWNFGDGEISKEANPLHKFEEPGSYTVSVVVKDQKGNRSTDQITIVVREGSSIKNPNVFSPNGDGRNDYFEFETKNITALTVQVIEIKSGRVLFETDDVNFKWDGRDKSGTKVDPGVYMYQFRAIDKSGKEYKGASQLTINY
ncbi:MAG: gliding motility-associated C-terminal domain-containing protein [Flavobacteriales bacterium]|nr:gliding motility-associated C-terminal domain-containing protein [Flavobacteriales bacterium]